MRRPILEKVLSPVNRAYFVKVLKYIARNSECKTPIITLEPEYLSTPNGDVLTTSNSNPMISDRWYYTITACPGRTVHSTFNTGVDPTAADPAPDPVYIMNRNAEAPYSFDLRVVSNTGGVLGPVVRIKFPL